MSKFDKLYESILNEDLVNVDPDPKKAEKIFKKLGKDHNDVFGKFIKMEEISEYWGGKDYVVEFSNSTLIYSTGKWMGKPTGEITQAIEYPLKGNKLSDHGAHGGWHLKNIQMTKLAGYQDVEDLESFVEWAREKWKWR